MGGRGRSIVRLVVIVFALLLASIAGYVVLPPRAAAATVVCGHLTGANVWTLAGSPYYLTCGVEVDAGASLSIESGVTVLATTGPLWGYLLVRGTLTVSGTANDPVVFDSNASMPARGDWAGISIWYTAYAQISGLVVRHAFYGLTVAAPSPSGQAFLLRDSEFAFNELGLDYGLGLDPVVGSFSGLSVHDNRVGIRTNTTIMVTSSTIQENLETGIAVWGTLYLTNSTVADNGGSGIAISAWIPPPGTYGRSMITCSAIARNGFGPTATGYGIDVGTDPGANVVSVSRNHIVDNAQQARDTGAGSWDDGRTGNFWSDYTGADGDGDGFGDTPYVIDADSIDHRPLIAPVPDCPGGGPGPVDRPPSAAAALDAQLTGAGLQDVTLTWDRSPDDGAGEQDVAAYLLYGSTRFNRAGAGYALLATLPPGTTTFTDAGAGLGDRDMRFYRLVAKDIGGQTTASADQFAKYARSLAAGPHLLSIPLRMSDTRIDTVLRGVDYRLARTYVNPAGQGKNWLIRAGDHPWGDLTDVDETRALWLLVNTDSDLVVAGLVRASVTVPLAVGWNFVGYPSFVDRAVGDALSGVRYQTVEGFDPSNGPYYLERLDATSVLRAGDGLWVHVSEPFDWTLTN